MAWVFEDWILDPEARMLLQGQNQVRLQPLVMDLLILLVENYPRYVPKAELYQRLWGEVRVGKASLLRLVAELRRALGDDSDSPRLVRTLHGRGYQFIAPVKSGHWSQSFGERG